MVSGALLPTADPFLYSISLTAMQGVPLGTLEAAAFEAIDGVRRDGLTAEELARAKRQLAARLVFETDSITNIAHQLGYYETIAGVDFYLSLPERIAAVTVDEVSAAARTAFGESGRTIGWFDPLPPAPPR